MAARVQEGGGKLLALRRLGTPFAGHWALPGGTVEARETPEEALWRELGEEVGISGGRARYLGAHWYERDADERTLTMLYEVETDDTPTNAEPVSHAEIGWVSGADDQLSPTARLALDEGSGSTATADAGVVAEPVDVLLLQPFFPLADEEALSIPLGLASLNAAAVATDVSIVALDCSLAVDYETFINDLEDFAARVVGVQFHSAMAYDFALRTCARLQRVFPDAAIVVGGELATMRYEEGPPGRA
ncbi:MAG: NUDIX domain-containing protein [Acidimicrobiia bacterium]|nr:NUDIX domain-containing protein [Acidimicrobiia bacterium]